MEPETLKHAGVSETPQLVSPFFTLEQAAAYAHCSTRTVQRWLVAGELARYGHGRKVLIHRAELEALLSPTTPKGQGSS